MKKKGLLAVLLALVLAAACCAAAAEGWQENEIVCGDWVYLRCGEAADVIRYTGSETDVTVPDTLDGLPVVALGQQYGECIFTEENRDQVVSVRIPDSVLMIGDDAFLRCTGLEQVNIPAHITTIRDNTFAQTALKSIELPPHLMEIGRYAFARTPLEEIRLPASVKWIRNRAFEKCAELKEIKWPGDTVYIGQDAFRETGIPEENFSLPAVYAAEGYTNRYYYYTPADAVRRVELKDGISIEYVCRPDGTAGILNIRVNSDAPLTLTVPDRVDGMPVTAYYGDLDDWNDKVQTLVLPDTMTEIGDMALNHVKASKITLPKKLLRIGHEALAYCTNLKEIKLPDSLRQIGYTSFQGSGADASAFRDELYNQTVAVGVRQEYAMPLGSISHYYDYDVDLDGMLCEVQINRENGEISLLYWETDPSCTLRESPDSWMNIPFVTVPRDSLRIRSGIVYRDTENGTLQPVQVTDADGWDWTFPDTVDGLQVEADASVDVRVMKDGLLCELSKENNQQGIRILQAAADWNGIIPETVGEYPVLWLGEEMKIRQDGLVFCGYRYKEKMLYVCGCETQEEEITVPESVQGWTVYCVKGYAFADLENLRSVTLPESVQEISEAAFSNCPALTEINVQNKKADIYSKAFRGIGLKWLEINGTSFSTAVPQEGAEYALFADGTAELLYWAPAGNTLKIPAEIDGHPVVSIADYAYRDNKGITSVELPEGLLRIGSEAFYSCEKLSSVKFPDTLEYIGSHAFNNDKKLSRVTFPASLKYMGTRAFSFTGLTSVVLPEGLEEVPDSAFYFCDHLTSVTLPEGLLRIGEEAFTYCRALSSISLPSTLQEIGANCFNETKLKKVVIPASVQFIGDNCFSNYLVDTGWGSLYYNGPEVVFEGDPQVTALTFGQLDTSKEYSYTEFWDRVELFIGHKIVKLKITTSPGTVVDRTYLSPLVVDKSYPAEETMTAGEVPAKATLEAADIPQGVQILTVPEGVERIAPEAFKGMHFLYRVILPESLREIGDSAFEDCGGLQYVTVGSGVEKIGARAFAGCRNLREIALPDGITEIPESCFEKDINLLKVTLPAGLVTIGKNAFNGCCYTEEVNLEACTALESIGERAFSRTGMRKIILPDSVRSLGERAFEYPTRMTELKLSAGLEEIPDYCFYHSNHLKSLEIPGNIRRIGKYSFYQARDLKDLKLSEGLETIDEGAFSTFLDNVLVYNNHGKRYSSLKKLAIPASVTKLGLGAFAGCDALTSITFEKGSALTEIPGKCFMLCTGLKDMTIPGFIQKVGNSAFAYCTVLSKVTVQEGTAVLEGQVFRECAKLKTLELPASLTNIGNEIMDQAEGVTVTVTAGSFAEERIRALYPKAKIKTRK